MSNESPAVFLDLSSLGSLRGSSPSAGVDRLDPFPRVQELLHETQAEGIRLGTVADPRQLGEGQLVGLLDASGLSGLLARELVFVGDMDNSATFSRAAELAGHADQPSRCVFVGEDRDRRGQAIAAGLRVAPHLRLAAAALAGSRIRYVRVTVPRSEGKYSWREVVSALELVPLRVVCEEDVAFYAIVSSAAASQLDDLGFQVDRLGAEDEPLVTEVYLLRDDRQARTGFLAPEGASSARFGRDEEASRVLASAPEGLYVALAPGSSVEGYHFEEARHGHTEKLLPDPSLLRQAGQWEAAAWVSPPAEAPVLADEERRAFEAITGMRIGSDIARYAGTEPLDESGTRIHSRHVLNPDNALAVETLVGDLQSIGNGQLQVSTHTFLHEGASFANVEAELSGAELDELVLVTAHLDSTAQFSEGYDPLQSAAPGADDDASGVAGVLSIARALAELRKLRLPRRRVRLVLFNAEEHGLVGSKAYARDEVALRAPIVGVFQMDMIGYNRESPRSFEVHAGFLPSAEVQERSRALAERIAAAARQVSPGLPAPQVYLSRGAQERDPAEGRSDHASFQLVGYPACVASEDFFAGPGADSPPEANPNYHKLSDTFVDLDYAADIARAVGAAAWLTANA